MAQYEFPKADHELTDDEILEQFGWLFEEAHRAFMADPTYVVAIAEVAGAIMRRRAAEPSEPETGSTPKPSRAREVAKRKRLTRDLAIRERRAAGASTVEVAAEFGLTVQTIRKIVKDTAPILRP